MWFLSNEEPNGPINKIQALETAFKQSDVDPRLDKIWTEGMCVRKDLKMYSIKGIIDGYRE
jgi:hypothetical protein